ARRRSDRGAEEATGPRLSCRGDCNGQPDAALPASGAVPGPGETVPAPPRSAGSGARGDVPTPSRPGTTSRPWNWVFVLAYSPARDLGTRTASPGRPARSARATSETTPAPYCQACSADR